MRGTNCTKCCLCQPRSRGRPRKDSVSSDSETLARSNPERQARIHHDTVASASSAVDMTPSIHVSDDRLEHVSASQAQILKVLDCEDGYESSVRRLPHIDVCRRVQYENELDAATIQRIDNVFRIYKGIKSNDLGKVKISVDGVFARLDELQLQKAIRLSELLLAGKISSVPDHWQQD